MTERRHEDNAAKQRAYRERKRRGQVGGSDAKDYALRNGLAIAAAVPDELKGKTGCQACGNRTGGSHKKGCPAGGGTVLSRVALA